MPGQEFATDLLEAVSKTLDSKLAYQQSRQELRDKVRNNPDELDSFLKGSDPVEASELKEWIDGEIERAEFDEKQSEGEQKEGEKKNESDGGSDGGSDSEGESEGEQKEGEKENDSDGGSDSGSDSEGESEGEQKEGEKENDSDGGSDSGGESEGEQKEGEKKKESGSGNMFSSKVREISERLAAMNRSN